MTIEEILKRDDEIEHPNDIWHLYWNKESEIKAHFAIAKGDKRLEVQNKYPKMEWICKGTKDECFDKAIQLMSEMVVNSYLQYQDESIECLYQTNNKSPLLPKYVICAPESKRNLLKLYPDGEFLYEGNMEEIDNLFPGVLEEIAQFYKNQENSINNN